MVVPEKTTLNGDVPFPGRAMCIPLRMPFSLFFNFMMLVLQSFSSSFYIYIKTFFSLRNKISHLYNWWLCHNCQGISVTLFVDQDLKFLIFLCILFLWRHMVLGRQQFGPCPDGTQQSCRFSPCSVFFLKVRLGVMTSKLYICQMDSLFLFIGK